MSSKIILVFCAQALLLELALTQCLGRDVTRPGYSLITPELADTGIAFANPCTIYITANSGNLPVSSFSATPPSGLFVASENWYEGPLAAAGELPFVGTAVVDSILPTAGAGAVNYGCGNGITEILAETVPAASAFSPAGVYGPIGAPAAAMTGAFPASSLGYNNMRGYNYGGCY